MKNENNGALAEVMRVPAIGVAGNILLALIKALAGFAAGSGALLSDAVHSAADLSSNAIAIFGVRISARESDREHPYGYERFECVAAIVLSVVLLITGLFIGLDAIKELKNGAEAEIPGRLALVVAVISIVVKEGLFRYTWFYAQKHGSEALRADAWHHRTDALCSVGVLIGVAGASMGVSVLDNVASLMICGFIAHAAYEIFRDASLKLVDRACGVETEDALRRCAQEQPGVLAVDLLHTREFGSRIYADMEIRVEGDLSLTEGYHISRQVHDAIEAQFPKVKHIAICAKPDETPKNSAGCDAHAPFN